jgi:dipeptidyl aminopeptidase/acylaminoacyl peptidase
MEKLGSFDAFAQTGFSPYFLGTDNTLLVNSGPSGGLTSLRRFDFKTMHPERDAIISLDGFDFTGAVDTDDDDGRILGYHYRTDADGTVWVNPKMRELQAKIDKALPGTINTIHCGACLTTSHYLIASRSDRQSPVFIVYDPANDKYSQVGAQYPTLKPAEMGTRDFARFAARDGLSIPVWVTLPPGKSKGPFPTIVYVHGGPFARGSQWEWSQIPQFLAVHGYAVIEPEFRGSEGFGHSFFLAGWKQWGLAMQDDVADAAKWAISKGYADPKRIAIGGASYGGYATLMGLIKDPEIYRCGFEWVGVTDLKLIYADNWNDAGDEYLAFGAPRMVGDLVKDADQIKATSPVEQADRLKQPLLMAYGGLDRRVPIVNGTEMRSALSDHNKNVEWISYASEGHGWYIEADDIDFWTHVLKFLDTNLRDAT